MKLPTRDECLAITTKTDAFYCTKKVVEGCNVELYDYRLASYTDFKDNDAFELRGLCFVENDGVWERNILLKKFFNINQTIDYMYDDVKDKKITRIQDKKDGSIVSFVRFPNGKIRAKSKMSFDSDQAAMAQDVFDNDSKLQQFVNCCLNNNQVPIFELVSPRNQIVLNYETTELVLLQIRDSLTGEYFTREEMNGLNVTKTEDFNLNLSLDDLLAKKETEQGIEGWIVTFLDGQMAKIKTNWYLSLHGLIGPDAFRENLLIQTILDGIIDDVISNLNDGTKKEMIQDITTKVEHKFNHLVKEFLVLRDEYFNKFNQDRKEFALTYSKTSPIFSGVMSSLNKQDADIEKLAEVSVKAHIAKKTNSLGDAQRWLEEII